MWPDSKGKGGKEGSPKSKDGGGDSKPNAGASGSSSGGKSGGKGRNTKTKMKALSAEGLPLDAAQAAAKLEQDIIKAAQNISQAQARAEETKTLIEANIVPESAVLSTPDEAVIGTLASLIRLPELSNEDMGDKISGLWKNRVLGAYRANPRASQHILPAMPNNRGALEITDKARAEAQHTAMITAVDKMFDSFQNLAFEFNNVASPELELTWIRPIISRENISSWHQAAQIVSVFTGRISTRYWTMVVRGTLDSVLAYVIPADKLLSFSNQPANFQPVIELIPVADGLAVRWSAMGRQASLEDLSNIYRALLDNMIRIAQNDAPCDRLIDLAAYGVTLDGPAMDMGAGYAQSPSPVIGQPIDSNNKYQPEFYREDAAPPSAPTDQNSSLAGIPNPFARPLPSPSSQPAPQSPTSTEDSGSADWKPVVRSVRGANPPGAPLSPVDRDSNAGAGPNQTEWTSGGQSLPGTPGFNHDEPWKYGGSVGAQTNSNTSINSLSAQSGIGRSNSLGGPGSGKQPSGVSPADEPPLPSLPAHLFEGLPPRPQTPPANAPLPGTSFGSSVSYPALPPQTAAPFGGGPGQSKSFDQPPPAIAPQPLPPLPQMQQGVPQPPLHQWTAGGAASACGSAGLASSSVPPPVPASASNDDGWKSAGIPIKKGMQSLPPHPVQGYQPSVAPVYAPESASLSGSLVSPESFTSGSIRVDAIAREIAQSAVSLPAAIPGFEPYKVDEPVAAPKPQNDFYPQPFSTSLSALNSGQTAPGSPSVDTWPGEPDEKPGQLWPKPRPLAKDSEPESEPVKPAAESDSEQNAFINFDSETEVESRAQNPDHDDPEIVALFEGEPVNASLSEPTAPTRPAEAQIEHNFSQDKDEDVWGPADGLATNGSEATAEATPENTAFTKAFFEGMNKSKSIDETESSEANDLSTGDSSGGHSQSSKSSQSSQYSQSFVSDSRAAIEAGFRMAQEAISASLESEPGRSDSRSGFAFGAFASAPPAVESDSFANSQSSSSSSSSVVADSVRSLKAEIDRLVGSLDSELEIVSAKGAEAFARRDLKGAERLIKLAETLSEFKESLGKLKQEHGADLS